MHLPASQEQLCRQIVLEICEDNLLHMLTSILHAT